MATIRPTQPSRARTPLPPWLLVSAMWAIPAVLAGFQQYMQGRVWGEPASWKSVLFTSVDWLFYGLLTPIVLRAGRRMPLRSPHLARHVMVHVVGALVLCVVWAALGELLRLALFGVPPIRQILRNFTSWTLGTLPFGVAVYFALVGIEHALFYFAQAREREVQTARLAAQVAESRLDALRMELHPHFLFNSLNAVAVLVRDNRTADAARVVEQLSEMLRELLSENVREIPLAHEIDFIRKYLAIELVRFSDRLDVRWNVPAEALQARVPSLILQPLVENALRHGVAARSARTTVEIDAQVSSGELRLAVSNDVPDAAARKHTLGRGVGLASTRERLATLYGHRATLTLTESEGRVRAEIRMPHEVVA